MRVQLRLREAKSATIGLGPEPCKDVLGKIKRDWHRRSASWLPIGPPAFRWFQLSRTLSRPELVPMAGGGWTILGWPNVN